MKSQEKHGNRKYEFDESFFEKINTEEKSYWLGFIYADGGMYSDGHKCYHLTIKLSSKDKSHLEKFQKSISSNHKIKERIEIPKFKSKKYNRPFGNCQIRITSVKMFNDLIKCGLHQNKSLTLAFPSTTILPEHLINHFIRGYFDGDGSISMTKSIKAKQMCLLGTKEFLNVIQKIFVSIIGLSKTKIVKRNKIYVLNYGGNGNIEKIKNYLYKNSFTWLDRKKKIFDIDIIKQSRVGKLNPSYNHNIYNFKNINTLEIFSGTQYDFSKKYNISNISRIVNKTRNYCKGWILM